jgi:hypothetical protein
MLFAFADMLMQRVLVMAADGLSMLTLATFCLIWLEFHGLEASIFLKAMQWLEKDNRAQVILSDETDVYTHGVKFL